MRGRLLSLLLLALAALPARGGVKPDFTTWLADFRQDAQAQGITPATLDLALGTIQPLPRVLELDQRQPEFVDTFWNYLDARVNARQLRLSHDKLWIHRKPLYRAQGRHGVPATLLVALWGMETRFGKSLGGFPTLSALATLAHDGRRAAFFRAELLNALRILQDGHASLATLKGSWAGALGQMQFMPSTFVEYAVDGDGDGRKDLWRSLPDAFDSAAEYLNRLGWRENEHWGREVRLPAGFDYGQATLNNRKPVSQWAALGVTLADGKTLPKSDLPGAILLPQGYAGPAFLVYRNFDVVMTWNRSINYALSALLLADRLQGLPPPRLGRGADNRRLSKDDVQEMQRLLRGRGFETGDPDGVPGSRTREAIRAFQETAGLPVDGFASATLLEQLRQTGALQARGPQPEMAIH